MSVSADQWSGSDKVSPSTQSCDLWPVVWATDSKAQTFTLHTIHYVCYIKVVANDVL